MREQQRKPADVRPIRFSASMIEALMSGVKTQTRRVMEPQPGDASRVFPWFVGDEWQVRPKSGVPLFLAQHDGYHTEHGCPYGKPGDRLYINERVTVKSIDSECPDIAWISYEADDLYRSAVIPERIKRPEPGEWKGRVLPWEWNRALPVHDASLVIKAVRVERLHDITDADACAEGCPGYDVYDYIPGEAVMHPIRTVSPLEHFRTVWDGLYGKRSPKRWDINPWVWVIEFDVRTWDTPVVATTAGKGSGDGHA